MKLVIQRVSHASVEVDGQATGKIAHGLALLLGIKQGDTMEQVEQLAKKVLSIRLWPDLKDPSKQWASNVVDNKFAILVVSQFTLFATFKKPKPDFHAAMGGDQAKLLYEAFVERCRAALSPDRVATGVFGAMMQVSICNEGPVTVELEAEPAAAPSSVPASSSASGAASPAAPLHAAAGAESVGGGRAGQADLEEKLAAQPYVGGYMPTRQDAELFAQMRSSETPAAPNLLRWYQHVGSFSEAERGRWA
mmetsp:Transcript_10834/g.27944  ORF Transcript_10834/g.27944 Transcript_10834/m.27944 type:complete len:250 (-) Transcript_10834:83-832(-)